MRSSFLGLAFVALCVPAGLVLAQALNQHAPPNRPAPTMLAPAPDSYTGYLPGLVIDQDGYPPAGVFGWARNTYSETLSVRRRIPASSATRTAPAALAGYAFSQSANAGAVGVFGQAAMSADAPGAWGGNFLVTNCAADDVDCTLGGHNTILYGAEIDVNEHPLPGGGPPLGTAFGLDISGGSTIRPTGGSAALHIDPMDGYSRALPWTQALLTEDGAALTGIRLGALANTGQIDDGSGHLALPHPTNSGSQSVAFRAIDPAGALHEAAVSADAEANLLLTPGQGSGFVVANGSLKTPGLENAGHYAAVNPDAPVLSGCGSATLKPGSNDTRETVNLPAGVSACAVNFRHPAGSAPFCVATSSAVAYPAAVLPPNAGGLILAVARGNPALAITWQCLD